MHSCLLLVGAATAGLLQSRRGWFSGGNRLASHHAQESALPPLYAHDPWEKITLPEWCLAYSTAYSTMWKGCVAR